MQVKAQARVKDVKHANTHFHCIYDGERRIRDEGVIRIFSETEEGDDFICELSIYNLRPFIKELKRWFSEDLDGGIGKDNTPTGTRFYTIGEKSETDKKISDITTYRGADCFSCGAKLQDNQDILCIDLAGSFSGGIHKKCIGNVIDTLEELFEEIPAESTL